MWDYLLAGIVIGFALGIIVGMLHNWRAARRYNREVKAFVDAMRRQNIRTYRVVEHD